MKLAIMQPYIFPYIGYFQLIQSVDTFVLFDDVQFIKGGWINRNRILINGMENLFTFSVEQASIREIIANRKFSIKFANEKAKFLKTLRACYSKAPHYNETMVLIEKIFSYEEYNIVDFVEYHLRVICEHLEIKTQMIKSSEVKKNNDLQAEFRVIDICKCLKGDQYINSIGGQDLYSRDHFNNNSIKLNFLKPRIVSYLQLGSEFVPHLSIIDIMMFNSKEEVKNLLKEYDLI
jgi:hypothetical protein